MHSTRLAINETVSYLNVNDIVSAHFRRRAHTEDIERDPPDATSA